MRSSKKFKANEANRPKQKATFGFSLIETLVAIAILSLAIAGPLSVISHGITSAIFAKDEITAMYLAQEGIEAVRNTRDGNVLAGVAWLATLDACENVDCGARFEPSSEALGIKACTAMFSTGCLLNYNSARGLYNHESTASDNAPSRFTRTIRIVPNVNGHEATVQVTVLWTSTVTTHSFTVVENLLNWQ